MVASIRIFPPIEGCLCTECEIKRENGMNDEPPRLGKFHAGPDTYAKRREDSIFDRVDKLREMNDIEASDQQVGGDHYKDMAIQPSEFIYKNDLNWLQGNAIKYICRFSKKGGEQDLDKAIHYLELLKEWSYEGE